MLRYLLALCRYIIFIESSAVHCDCLTAVRFFQYSILSIKDSTPQALAAAKVYYSSIDFAFNLCKELAAAERGNAELLEPLEHASKLLERIVAHNALLKSSDLEPAWPRHEALVRFDLTLQRLTTHFLVSKKWFLRNMSLRGSRLYYSDGNNGHPDTAAGTLAFMRSNPAPDGRYCMDLKGACACCATAALCCASQSLLDAGCSVAPCSAAVDGQAFAFEIKFPADHPAHKDVCLAAADDVTRQRCVRIIEAASAGGASSSLPDIASSAALTRGLLDMKSLAAVKAVLAALDVAIDHPSLKAVGFDLPSLKAAGFSSAAALKSAGCSFSALVLAGFSAAELTEAGFSSEVKVSYADIFCIFAMKS